MEFASQITVGGRMYRHVDTQRGGTSAIYKDDINYLRIGESDKMRKDLTLHKKLESLGFPVPKLLGEGSYEGMYYFIEESLGEDHFGNIFRKETEKYGHIQDQTFDQFVRILALFAKAQLNTATSDKAWDSFKNGIHLDFIINELPDKEKEILRAYKMVGDRLSVLPFALVHGDLTPFNVYPKGVIDFEDSFVGSVGYDLGTIIEHLNWFPESRDFEYYKVYNFTVEQKKRISDMVDELYREYGLPRFSDYLDDLNFVRGVWFTVRNFRSPKLQKYRYKLFSEVIDQILKKYGTDIER